MLFSQTSDPLPNFHVWIQSKETFGPHCLLPTVKLLEQCVRYWEGLFWKSVCPMSFILGRISIQNYLIILSCRIDAMQFVQTQFFRKRKHHFTQLRLLLDSMGIILTRENILSAYHNSQI